MSGTLPSVAALPIYAALRHRDATDVYRLGTTSEVSSPLSRKSFRLCNMRSRRLFGWPVDLGLCRHIGWRPGTVSPGTASVAASTSTPRTRRIAAVP